MTCEASFSFQLPLNNNLQHEHHHKDHQSYIMVITIVIIRIANQDHQNHISRTIKKVDENQESQRSEFKNMNQQNHNCCLFLTRTVHKMRRVLSDRYRITQEKFQYHGVLM